ncbi:hypothetical protein HPP92_026986 [Vanilla planifolia]|uniref:Uncharacterized protein n=1 Tax=Vanilla planifolia TaxID=51239 RepID=A0A835PD96_VANPL|nr:hypothetical protein HPP92_027129 [Vanilla planifolia]KAG0450016.1 hypothetical protein HPP92_026986 [Vanilla planifolia]
MLARGAITHEVELEREDLVRLNFDHCGEAGSDWGEDAVEVFEEKEKEKKEWLILLKEMQDMTTWD